MHQSYNTVVAAIATKMFWMPSQRVKAKEIEVENDMESLLYLSHSNNTLNMLLIELIQSSFEIFINM